MLQVVVHLAAGVCVAGASYRSRIILAAGDVCRLLHAAGTHTHASSDTDAMHAADLQLLWTGKLPIVSVTTAT